MPRASSLTKTRVASLKVTPAEYRHFFAAAKRAQLRFAVWARQVLAREADRILSESGHSNGASRSARLEAPQLPRQAP